MSQKRRAGEITEWRRGVGLRSPTSGAAFPLRGGLFSVLRGVLPLQTACRCVCRGGRIGHVRYRPGCFDFHAGGSIVGQMAFGLAPRSAGRMKKPLVKVRLASGFSYVGHEAASIVPTLLMSRKLSRLRSWERTARDALPSIAEEQATK